MFTALFRDRDYLREIPPRFVEEGVDYFCFTDDPDLRSSTYQVVYIGPVEDGRLEARRYKMLMEHPLLQSEYDYFIWLDASVYIRSRLTSMLAYMQLANADIQAFCYVGRRQPWSGLLVRRRSPRMDHFNRLWFEATVQFGTENKVQIRDEFVFFETLERSEIRLNLVPITVLPFFAFSNHHKGRSLLPRFEKWILSNRLSLPGPWSLAIDYPISFLLKRDKFRFILTSLRKAGFIPWE